MYAALKGLVLRVIALDPKPLTEPLGSKHERVLTFSAAPAYLSYRLVGWAIGAAFMGALGLAASVGLIATGEIVGIIGALILVLMLLMAIGFGYFMVRIDYDLRTYMVTDRSLRIREGALYVREMTLTFANIQNLKITQGPLERMFGIRNLEVETAGGGGQGPNQKGKGFSFHVGYLRGIDNAEEIRELIRGRIERMEAGGDARAISVSPAPNIVPAVDDAEELKLYRQINDQIKDLTARLML